MASVPCWQGHWNHTFFWGVMAPAASPEASYARSASPELKAAIESKFGSANDMKLKFTDAALGLFGSGWTWLGVDPAGSLVISTTPNQARARSGLSLAGIALGQALP